SANDALNGETKTFESRWAALIVFHNPNENAFDADRTSRSAEDSSLGSELRALAGSDVASSAGPVLPLHAAMTRGVSSQSRRIKDIGIPLGRDAQGVVRHSAELRVPVPKSLGVTLCALTAQISCLGCVLRGDFPDLTGRARGKLPIPHPSKSLPNWAATKSSGPFFILAGAPGDAS